MTNIPLPQMLIYILLFFLAASMLSLFFTKICINVLPLLGLVDIPRGRHKHERIVPRGGGIAFILAFGIVTFLYFALTGNFSTEALVAFRGKLLLELGVPLFLITILGILDDKFELPSKLKLLVQLVIAVYFYFAGAGINLLLGFPLPVYIALPLTVIWVIGITNAFNLIDGMDGVAAGLASISAMALAVWLILSGNLSDHLMLLVIFSGACVGFLRYNFAPAKIFMGDTGSLFIGAFFAYFSMARSAKAFTLTSLLVPVLAMGVPIFDVFLAIVRRLYRKYILKDPDAGVMTGDHDHIHHRIQDDTKDQKKTAFSLYLLAIVMVFGAMAAALVSNIMQALSFAILLVILFAVVRFATIEFYDAATLVSEGIRVPHQKFLFTAIHPVADILLLVGAYCISVKLHWSTFSINAFSYPYLLCYLAPFPLVLCFSGIYRTFWMRAGIERFFKLFLMYALAAVLVLALALGILILKYGVNMQKIAHMKEFFITYVLLGALFIMTERFLLHYLESYAFKNLGANVEARNNKIKRTIVYGGGLNCRLFLASQYAANGKKAERKIIGLVDDNPSLHGLNVYGLDVLGKGEDLPLILKKHDFNEVVVAFMPVPETTRRRLLAFGKEHQIKIVEFRFSIEDLDKDAMEK